MPDIPPMRAAERRLPSGIMATTRGILLRSIFPPALPVHLVEKTIPFATKIQDVVNRQLAHTPNSGTMSAHMTLTTHALVGAAAASFFPEQPYLAFAAGFASHFAIDAIPHWDYDVWLRSFVNKENKLLTDMRWGRDFWHDLAVIGADALLGFVLTFFVAGILGISQEIALVGAGAGIYPDVLQFIYYKARKHWFGAMMFEPLQRFHMWVQWKELKNLHPALGIGMQVLLVVVLVGLISRL